VSGHLYVPGALPLGGEPPLPIEEEAGKGGPSADLDILEKRKISYPHWK